MFLYLFLSGDVFVTAGELESTHNTAESAAAASTNLGIVDDDERPLQKSTPSLPPSLFLPCVYPFSPLAIELRIDRRCTLAELKTRLEEYVQVPSSEFKVHNL